MAGGVKQDPGLVQRALSGHAAIGLIIGALLYLVCLSGSLAVLQEHLQRWEEPQAFEMDSITPEAAQKALETILQRQGKPTEHAFIHLPTEGLPRVVITTDNGAAYVDAEGRFNAPEAHSWTEFVLFLHYYLNLPMTVGLFVTGALGVMLCAAALTGVIAHPKIFRDAFRMRLRGRKQLSRSDLHNRLGVWLLPFIAALGLTGAVLGLGELVFGAIAQERHGGDFEASYAPLFGPHPMGDHTPAPVARADRALHWMAANRPEYKITYVTIDEAGTAGQRIQVLADHDRRLIYGETYLFDGEGRYLGQVGLSDGQLGQQAVASLYKLHFGNFGGIPVELAYLVFGLALCAIISTGTTLWLMKRRARGKPSPRLEALWTMIIWGTPIALMVASWTKAALGEQAPLVVIFWLLLAAGCALAIAIPQRVHARQLRGFLGTALFLTGLVHFVGFYPLPGSSILIDGTLVMAGILLAIPFGARRYGSAVAMKPQLS